MMKKRFGRVFLKLFVVLFCSLFYFNALAAIRKKERLWRNTRIELKTGTARIFREVPFTASDLQQIVLNDDTYTSTASLTLKVPVANHFALGYQLEYLWAEGTYQKAAELPENIKVPVSVIGNSVTLNYYSKKILAKGYRANYHLFYKAGAISLMPHRDSDTKGVSMTDSGIGVLTGMGIGVQYLVRKRLALSGGVEYNHISSSLNELFQPYHLFGQTSHTVSNFLKADLGVSYQLFPSISKRSGKYYNTRRGSSRYLPWARKFR